jgi:hypothetical protein
MRNERLDIDNNRAQLDGADATDQSPEPDDEPNANHTARAADVSRLRESGGAAPRRRRRKKGLQRRGR